MNIKDYRFLFFKTRRSFEEQKKNISENSIAFIQDESILWTHDAYFNFANGSLKHIFLTQSEYDALKDYEKDALYFIVEDTWTFGDVFPVILS